MKTFGDDTTWRTRSGLALSIAVPYTTSCYSTDDRGNIAKAMETKVKIFSILHRFSAGARNLDRRAREHWVRDPLAHPDLAPMNQRELGDLPFSRGLRRSSDC